MKNHGKLVSLTVSLALIVGLAIYEVLANLQLAILPTAVITFLASTAFYELVFRLLVFLCSNVPFLKKVIWGRLYLEGFWLYTYDLGGEKRYGAWCIEQDYNSISVKGFGLSNDGKRRSDVQSVSQLIERGRGYEIVNMRRDVRDGAFEDDYYYSKTTLNLYSRNTFLNFMNYPLEMSGVTIVYGGPLSGNRHGNLKFIKSSNAETEKDIEQEVIGMITSDMTP